LQSHHEPTTSPAKLPIRQTETRTNGKTSNQPIENRANSKEFQEIDRKLERMVATSNYRTKPRTNGRKLEFTEQNFERTVETRTHRTKPQRNGGKWLHQHTATRKLQKPQELKLWMGTGFTRPHGGRLMILPVDQNTRASPRQRYLPPDRLCTMLASVLHTSIHLKNQQKTEWRHCGRSRSDAQVS